MARSGIDSGGYQGGVTVDGVTGSILRPGSSDKQWFFGLTSADLTLSVRARTSGDDPGPF